MFYGQVSGRTLQLVTYLAYRMILVVSGAPVSPLRSLVCCSLGPLCRSGFHKNLQNLQANFKCLTYRDFGRMAFLAVCVQVSRT